MSEPGQPGPHQPGLIENLVGIVKSLTMQNVMTLAVLVAVLAPTYLLWRVLNDASMLGKILSSYEEHSSDKMPCTLRIASLRGSGSTYAISTGFAYQGSDRWVMSVIMDRDPRLDGGDDLQSYCETLNLLIDYMRTHQNPPSFPGTEDPMVHMYPQ